MAKLDKIQETLRKVYAKRALEYLRSPPLSEVMGDNPKWDIVQIRPEGFVVKHKETGEISFCPVCL